MKRVRLTATWPRPWWMFWRRRQHVLFEGYVEPWGDDDAMNT